MCMTQREVSGKAKFSTSGPLGVIVFVFVFVYVRAPEPVQLT